jgi:hypothetical protein
MVQINFESEEAVRRDAEKVLRALKRCRQRVTGPDDIELRGYLSDLRGRAGIYGVFSGESLVYVGKTRDAAKRISDHFVKCSPSTRSKIREIQVLLASRAAVWVAFVDDLLGYRGSSRAGLPDVDAQQAGELKVAREPQVVEGACSLLTATRESRRRRIASLCSMRGLKLRRQRVKKGNAGHQGSFQEQREAAFAVRLLRPRSNS